MSVDEFRTAIIIVEDLDKGAAANAAAIVLAQLSVINKNILDTENLHDDSGTRHAAIKSNVVILKCKSYVQIINHINSNKKTLDKTSYIVFTEVGRSISNDFMSYKKTVENNSTDFLKPLAFGIFGYHDDIKHLTKKFSVMK